MEPPTRAKTSTTEKCRLFLHRPAQPSDPERSKGAASLPEVTSKPPQAAPGPPALCRPLKSQPAASCGSSPHASLEAAVLPSWQQGVRGGQEAGPSRAREPPTGAGTGQHRSHSPRLSAAGAGVTWWLKQRWPLLAAAGLPPAPRNTALFPRQPTESWFTEPRCSHHGPSKLCKVMGFPGKVAGDRHRLDFGVHLRLLGAGQTLASSWDELGASPEEGVL